MTQNLVDMMVGTDNLARMDSAIVELEAALAGLVSLTPEQRRSLPKMGDRSEAFCRAALNVAMQHPGVMARDFEMEAFQRDMQALDLLRPRFLRIAHLYQRASDTETALGSDLMSSSLEVYGVMKVSGKGKSLDDARRNLGSRFRTRTASDDAAPESGEAD